jgi:hypothetical protein
MDLPCGSTLSTAALSPWAGINGDPHNFSPADIQNLAKAMERYIFALS